MLEEVSRFLRCPSCGQELTERPGSLGCLAGHSFDLARQGYVHLLPGGSPAGADTKEMLSARADLLGAGLFDFLTAAVAGIAAELSAAWPAPPGLVVDIGAGTGHYLAAVLDRLPGHHGLALDVAKSAVRRAARAHARTAAAVADAWRRLPVADGCADLVLDIFAPRNAPEFRRILRPTGALVVVTPEPSHLGELVERLDLIRVDPDKDRRLAETFIPPWRLRRRERYGRALHPARTDVANLVAMGPSAWHIEPARLERMLDTLPDGFTVTASVLVSVYAP